MNERTEQDERERFEAWAKEHFQEEQTTFLHAENCYLLGNYQSAWIGWQAALSQASNSVAVQEPVANRIGWVEVKDGLKHTHYEGGATGYKNLPDGIHNLYAHPITSQEGWQLVPIEPTEAMLNCIGVADIEWHGRKECYERMLSAAPTLDKEGMNEDKTRKS